MALVGDWRDCEGSHQQVYHVHSCPARFDVDPRGASNMARAKDCVTIEVPSVLRDRIRTHRLHPRQPFHEIIEEALEWWENSGAWTPYTKAAIDDH